MSSVFILPAANAGFCQKPALQGGGFPGIPVARLLPIGVGRLARLLLRYLSAAMQRGEVNIWVPGHSSMKMKLL